MGNEAMRGGPEDRQEERGGATWQDFIGQMSWAFIYLALASLVLSYVHGET